MKAFTPNKLALVALVATIVWAVPDHSALAAATGGGAMPYSTALQTLLTSFGGEVALLLMVCGAFGALAYWYFGGEIGQLMASLVKMAMIGGILGTISAAGLAWMGTAGAVV